MIKSENNVKFAICDRQILLSCDSSELCFRPTKLVLSDKNLTRPPIRSGRFLPKSETVYAINSLINNFIYKEPNTNNKKQGERKPKKDSAIHRKEIQSNRDGC